MADQEESNDQVDSKPNLSSENENGAGDDGVDTTADFLRIFQGKTEFDSWEEFNTLFEEFQKETGSGKNVVSVTAAECVEVWQ